MDFFTYGFRVVRKEIMNGKDIIELETELNAWGQQGFGVVESNVSQIMHGMCRVVIIMQRAESISS